MENLSAVIEGNVNSKAAAMFVAVLAELSDIYQHYNLGSHQDFIQEVLVNQFKSNMTGEKCWKLLNGAAENPEINKNINLKYELPDFTTMWTAPGFVEPPDSERM